MTESKFYSTIKENTIDGQFIGFWRLNIGKGEVHIDFIGTFDNPIYYVSDDMTKQEKEYTSIEEVLNEFLLEGKPLREQIDMVESMICDELID